MRIALMQQMSDELCDALSLPHIPVVIAVWPDKCCAHFDPNDKRIQVQDDYAVPLTVLNIIKHEVSHYWVHYHHLDTYEYGYHNLAFFMIAKAIGCDAQHTPNHYPGSEKYFHQAEEFIKSLGTTDFKERADMIIRKLKPRPKPVEITEPSPYRYLSVPFIGVGTYLTYGMTFGFTEYITIVLGMIACGSGFWVTAEKGDYDSNFWSIFGIVSGFGEAIFFVILIAKWIG